MERLPADRFAFESAGRESAGRNSAHAECLEHSELFDAEVLEADERFAQLARAIESEIIPRLMLAHRVAAERLTEPLPTLEVIAAGEVSEFARLVLAADETLPMARIAALCERGVSIETIYVDLLAPTARYFGDLWTQDLCDFTEVTVGLGRLQQLLRELSPTFGTGVAHPANGRRILLLPGPGEQHTFGLVMVSEFFSRAGWDVTGGAWAAAADGPTMVRDEWFDVIGFSVAADVHLSALQQCIADCRRAACNRSLAVMVGGPTFTARPDYVSQVGADAMASDGRAAPTLAETLIVQRTAH